MYLSYLQFQAFRKSIIISDLLLIILTIITFFAQLFNGIAIIVFIFAVACFLVKLFSNIFIEKQIRFPAFIHLFAPVPLSCIALIISAFYIFYSFLYEKIFKDEMITIISLPFAFVFIAFIVYETPIKKFIKFKYIFPSVAIFNYYNLISNFTKKEMAICLSVFQIACFISIVLSMIYSIDFGEHPIESFFFEGLFAPLLFFALFNIIEIFTFLTIKFPQEGKGIKIKKFNLSEYIITMFLAIIMAFFITKTPHMAEPFVKSYLGLQYEPIMEKLIK